MTTPKRRDHFDGDPAHSLAMALRVIRRRHDRIAAGERCMCFDCCLAEAALAESDLCETLIREGMKDLGWDIDMDK